VKILVSGGAGFIGSHLCERLVSEDHEVICIDNLVTGNEGNIEHLKKLPTFRFVKHDVTRPIEISAEAIFHLASPASPPGYLSLPVETSLANSVGTYNLLELARKNKAKFLMASTSEVYGEPLQHPQREDYWGNVNPVGVRSCYDEGKRFAESLTATYHRHFNVDTRIVRIFNTYGPKSDPNDGRIVPNFVTQALLNKPITVYGSGKQTRSLCYIDDLVEGMIRAMFWPGTEGIVVNLGNPEEHTVLEYAELIRKLCNSSSSIVHVPQISEDDPTRRCPDIEKARTLLGWSPRVGLEEGLTATIAWFRQRLGIN